MPLNTSLPVGMSETATSTTLHPTVTVIQVITAAASWPSPSMSGMPNTIHDMGLDSALLIGWSLGILLYGALTMAFFPAIVLLIRRQTQNRVIIGALVALWVLATVQTALSGVDIYRGFITYRRDGGPEMGDDGTLQYFCFSSSVLPVAESFPYYFSVIISDAILVWRLWMLWPEVRWIAALPGSLLVGSVVSGAVMLARSVQQLKHDPDFFVRHSLRWSAVWFAFVFATNFTATGMIVGRLLWVRRTAPHEASKRTYGRVVGAVIESASIYTSVLLVQLIFTALDRVFTTQLILYIIPMLAALAPTMIILRLQLQLGTSPTQSNQSNSRGVSMASRTARESSLKGDRLSQLEDGSEAELYPRSTFKETKSPNSFMTWRPSDEVLVTTETPSPRHLPLLSPSSYRSD